jgi:hypothetical protein
MNGSKGIQFLKLNHVQSSRGNSCSRIATPENLLHVFTVEESVDGSAQALWTFWFERAETTLADVEEVFANAGH